MIPPALPARHERAHVAARDPLLVATVFPQCDQIGAGAHRAHHMVELLLAVAVPDRERRKIVGGERRLLSGDGVQRHAGIGDDLIAVLAGDAGVILDPLGLKPLFRPARCGRTDLVLRLKLYPLRLIGAMTDPPFQTQLGHALVQLEALHASRQSFNSSVLFEPRFFFPNRSGPTSRIATMTCACGFGLRDRQPSFRAECVDIGLGDLQLEVGHRDKGTELGTADARIGDRDAG